MLMPFQVLGMWFRGLLALLLLGLGIYLLYDWYSRLDVEVVERPLPGEVRRPAANDEPVLEPPADGPVVERPEVRRVRWEFGLNRETAALLGGATLLLYSLLGGLIGPPWRRRGADEPKEEEPGTVHRLERPDGSILHVEVVGPEDGQPIIMTHGWGLNHHEWYYARRQLGSRYRLILWDLPGLGQSTGPRDDDYGLDRLAGHLEAVLQFAGNRPAVLVGHSIGGMILLTFCKLFPDALRTRVRGLVIAHSTYTNPVRTTRNAGLYTALQKPVLEPLCHLMVWLAPLVWAMNWLSYLNGSAHRSTDRDSFSGNETRGQLNFITRHYVSAWPAVLARGMLAMFRYDATAVLGTIPVPTLVVAGDQDPSCKPDASEHMSRAIPGARLVTLAPAKHLGLFEHHAGFHEQVDAFCAAGAASPGQPVQAEAKV